MTSEFIARLENTVSSWGVSENQLIALLIILALGFVLSFRHLVLAFLGIYRVQRNQELISSQVAELKEQLALVKKDLKAPYAAAKSSTPAENFDQEPQSAPTTSDKKRSKAFRISH